MWSCPRRADLRANYYPSNIISVAEGRDSVSCPIYLGNKTSQQQQLFNQFLTRLVSIIWRCWHISLPYSDETKICAALSPNLSVQLHESFVFQSPHCSCFRNYSFWRIMCLRLTIYWCLLHTFQPPTFTKKSMCCGSCAHSYHSREANITLVTLRQTIYNWEINLIWFSLHDLQI